MATGDFQTSSAGAIAFVKGQCCNYGSKYDKTATGYDCAIIPSPSKFADSIALHKGNDGFCGGQFASMDGTAALTVCCKYFVFYTLV